MQNQPGQQDPNFNPNQPNNGNYDPNLNNGYPVEPANNGYSQNPNNFGKQEQHPNYNYPQNQYPNSYPADVNQQFDPNQQFIPTGFAGPGGNPNQQPGPKQKPKWQINLYNFLVKKWWLVAIVVVALASLIIVAVVVLNQPTQVAVNTKFPNVVAKINAPKTLPQGTPGVFELSIENKEAVPVSNLKIDLKFDSDFQFLREISPKPDVPEGNKYTIAKLDEAGGRSSSVKITFEGILTGKTDIEVQMSGTITYQAETGPGKLSPVNETKIDIVRTKITSPQIDLNLTPTVEQVQNNGEAEFTIKLNNRTDQEIRDLRVRMTYPSGQNSFTYTSSEYTSGNTASPKTSPDDGDNTWLVTRLAGGSEHILKVRGKVLGSSNSLLTFGVEIGIKTQNNDYRVIRETFKDIKILAQPIKLTTAIVGKDASKVIVPGETLTFSVNYQNDSQQTFNNVQITSFVTDIANLLDLSTINFAGGERGDITGSQISWQATRVPQLATLRPSQSGQFQYTIKVKELSEFINVSLNQTQYTIRPGVQAKAANLEQIEFVGELYKGRGQLEFFQDEPVFKNFNPQTNNNVYSFTWRLRTWQNEVNDVVFKAVSPLPAGGWLNKITPAANSSSLSYNNVNGEIIWTVGKLNSYTGRSIPEVSITFEMEVPKMSSKQIAIQIPVITGTDIFTSEKFNFTGKVTELDSR